MKYIMSLLVCMLFVPSAFAQFKTSAQAALNQAQLKRLVKQAALKKQPTGSFALRVPSAAIPGGKTVLSPRAIPVHITPANHSFQAIIDQTRSQLPGMKVKKKDIAQMMSVLWGYSSVQLPALGKGFYNDQSALARDLDRYYGGKETLRLSPSGRKVKFYALPVEGILYQPAEYKVPVVLRANDYFVIYDVDAHTGQIARALPDLYASYPPCTFPQLLQELHENYQAQKALRDSGANEELWESIGGERTYNDAEILLTRDVVDFYRQRARLETLRRSGIEGTDEELINLTQAKYQARYEPTAPRVRDVDGKEGYVLELPLNGLRYMQSDVGLGVVLDPQYYVVFYVPGQTPVVIERSTLEDPSLFGPVEKPQ